MKQSHLHILVVLAALLLSANAWADLKVGDTFETGGIEYQVKSTSPLEVMIGDGKEAAIDKNTAGAIEIPASVEGPDGNSYSVTSIAVIAFENCKDLTTLTIPNTIKSLGLSAFRGCEGLISFTIPNSVTDIGSSAFEGCIGLTSVIIPNSVTDIGNDTFCDCIGLTSVTIPNSVTSIGYNAFSGCSSLTSVTIPNSVTNIGSFAFCNCSGLTSITIPNSVTSIGDYAFTDCSSLNSIIVEEGNTVYDSRNNCNAIIKTETNELITGCMNTIIPNTVTRIGDFAFDACTGLTSMAIPNSVTSIGIAAFGGCSGLTSVTIPNSVTSIENGAFNTCLNLTEVYSLLMEPFAINNVVFGYYGEDEIELFTSATLYVPAGTNAKYEATDGWKEFKNIVEMTPYEVKEDGTAIVKNLEPDEDGKLVIPEKVEIDGKECSVTEIAPEALRGNQDLVEVTIPGTVIAIGAGAFAGCGNLKAIYLMSATPIALSQAAARGMIRRAERTTVSQFDGVDYETCVLYVPYGSGEAYRNAEGWNLFKHIVEMEDTGINGATLYDDITNGKCYDLKGRRISQPGKGVNILRDSYGRTRKVMKK